MMDDEKKKVLIGMTLAQLKQVVGQMGMPSFTAIQIAKWIYQKGVADIDSMTDISKSNRMALSDKYIVGAMPPEMSQTSSDGTKKYLFPTSSGKHVETVFIPDGDRATLCLSSQVGCKMNCLFCQTGKQGFEGNLTAGDILNQIMQLPERERLTNIVYMGQGEPLDNLEACLTSSEILTSSYGWQWSPKRITISTVGIKGRLKRLLDESFCHIAISMHSASPDIRQSLMPAEKAYSISDIVALLKEYDFSHQRRVSFEYIMFKGINDTLSDGRSIVSLLKGLECRVNLIRFHSIPGVSLESSDNNTMESFRNYLTSKGIISTIRKSRGEDILAACGLLTTANKAKTP